VERETVREVRGSQQADVTTGRRTPVKRPETARPRSVGRDEAEPAPPERSDLDVIESQLVWLAELLGATAAQEGDGSAAVVRWPGRGPGFNYAARVRWSDDDWSSRLAALSTRHAAEGGVPAIVFADGQSTPQDLGARLEASGWLVLVRETVMWTRRAAVVPHLDPSMRIEAVTGASAREYEAVEREIFGVSPLDAVERVEALRRTIHEGTQRAYLVRVAGDPVATARLAARDGVAALHGIGVVERWRRRGYGSLITTVATRAALATGNRLVWLSVADANEPARRLYQGLDYRPAFGWRLLLGPPA
jgi:GNAT superfamily N-acetyltransferase